MSLSGAADDLIGSGFVTLESTGNTDGGRQFPDGVVFVPRRDDRDLEPSSQSAGPTHSVTHRASPRIRSGSASTRRATMARCRGSTLPIGTDVESDARFEAKGYACRMQGGRTGSRRQEVPCRPATAQVMHGASPGGALEWIAETGPLREAELRSGGYDDLQTG